MTPEKRITKAQIKQDRLVTAALKASQFVQEHRRQFIWGGVAVGVVVLIIVVVFAAIGRRNAEAEELFGKAQLATAFAQWGLAISDYTTVVRDYGSTRIAPRACYFLADAYYRQRNYDSAYVYYEKFTKKYGGDKLLTPASYAGAASCLEQKQEYAKAAEMYLEAAHRAADSAWASEYLMGAARAFAKAGLLEEAQKTYKEVAEGYARFPASMVARRKLEEITYRKQDS